MRACVSHQKCLMEEEKITDRAVTIASLFFNGSDKFFREDPGVIFCILVLVPALLPDPPHHTFLLQDTVNTCEDSGKQIHPLIRYSGHDSKIY